MKAYKTIWKEEESVLLISEDVTDMFKKALEDKKRQLTDSY